MHNAHSDISLVSSSTQGPVKVGAVMSVGPRYEYEVSTQLLGLATHCAKMMIQQPGHHQPSANMQLSREQEPFIVSCHTKLRGPHGRSAFKHPVSNAVDCGDVMLGAGRWDGNTANCQTGVTCEPGADQTQHCHKLVTPPPHCIPLSPTVHCIPH